MCRLSAGARASGQDTGWNVTHRNPLGALFDPDSVAVFGATGRIGAVGYYVLRNLLQQGFAGEVVPVNPGHREVLGRPCHPSLAAAGRGVDLAVITTPAHVVPDVVRDCAATGTPAAIVISAGFGSADPDGPALRREVTRLANEAGIRFVGPNCLGLIRPSRRLNATFLNLGPPAGGLALVSQSGAICSAIVDLAEARGLGFSAVLSLGNSLNLGLGDAIGFLAEDVETRAVLAYVEGVRNAPKFLEALRAASATKPVIVLKAGRHAGGARAATTHTDALIGSDEVFAAAVEQSGGVQVGTLGDLLAAAEILTSVQTVGGNRLAVVTNGGGAGVLAADRAGDLGVELPPPGKATLTTLDRVLPPFWSRRNPLDILGDAPADHFRAALQACDADPAFDATLVLLSPQAMTDVDRVAEAVRHGSVAGTKPVLACLLGDHSVHSGRRALEAARVPSFTLPERAVEAFAYLQQHGRAQVSLGATPEPRRPACPTAARKIIDAALTAKRHMLSDVESKHVLTAFGISCTLPRLAATRDEAVALAAEIGRSVAVKIASPDISHKSDVDGVRLGLRGPAEVGAAVDDLLATAARLRPAARLAGVTVEPMASATGARELLIGLATDPVFGPVVTFGAGGTMVEVLQDSAVALPPLDRRLARRLVERTRVSRALGAFRNLAPVDMEALEAAIVAISDLALALPEVVSMDINPLFAAPDGVLVVDARMELRKLRGGDPAKP